jgi:hypothetical protein
MWLEQASARGTHYTATELIYVNARITEGKGREWTLPPFWTYTLDGEEWSASRPGHLTTGETTLGIHWIGVSVGHRTLLDDMEKGKSCPCRDSNTCRPASSSSYTDPMWVIRE